MKILMTKAWQAPEYLDDSVLHGLRSILGHDVVESPRMWHMYSDSFGPGKKDLSSIAARGFTLYGMLDDSSIDRSDIERKIITGYFDLIVSMPWYPSPYLPLILEHTPPSKIAWLDGHDRQEMLPWFIGKGHYFKRELGNHVPPGVYPISFAFPANKIQAAAGKMRSVAHVIPGNIDTYIYDNESDYYDGYNQSLFGITQKKGGWDCLRHYEILGSRCVPWFLDIAFCPRNTCTSLPKNKFLEINRMINEHGANAILTGSLRDRYEEIRSDIHDHFVTNCTTESLAKYLLDQTYMIIS